MNYELLNCQMEPCELNIIDFNCVNNNDEYGTSSSQNCSTSINATDSSNPYEKSIFSNPINEILVGVSHNEIEVCSSPSYNCNVRRLECDSAQSVGYGYEPAVENEKYNTNSYQQGRANITLQTERNFKEMKTPYAENTNKENPFFDNYDQTIATNFQDISSFTSNFNSIYANSYFNFPEKFNRSFVECPYDPVFNMEASNNWCGPSFDLPKNSFNQEISLDSKLSYADELTGCEPEIQSRLCSNENEKNRIDKKAVQHNLHWIPVFPRNKFNQVADIIVKHPLRTRKVISSCRQSSGGTINTLLKLSEEICSNENNEIVDKDNTINIKYKVNLVNDENHSVPDFSEITIIPTITSDRRSKVRKENRRKQKLDIIPGAEYLEFEVQKNYIHEQSKILKGKVDRLSPVQHKMMYNKDDPYPEIELPELNNIFRRKKKICSTPTTGTKKKIHICQSLSNQISEIQDEFYNFKEHISYTNLINSEGNISNAIVENNVINNSESDSGDSIDNMEDNSQFGESLKCLKCKKLFKSNRFLALHLKRCDKNYINNTVNNEGKNYKVFKNIERTYTKPISSNTNGLVKIDKIVRPLTRSQVRRSTKT